MQGGRKLSGCCSLWLRQGHMKTMGGVEPLQQQPLTPKHADWRGCPPAALSECQGHSSRALGPLPAAAIKQQGVHMRERRVGRGTATC
jgi:hypothetical protein